MRKIQKEQISEMIATLEEACLELGRLSGDSFVKLCAGTQEFLIELYKYVERVLGVKSRLATLLAVFNERLFEAANGACPISQLTELICEIKAEASGLQPDTLEVAFFCYKASMADSLESVYLAAKKDPSCDAFFIPIPYFEWDENGCFGPTHFDGVDSYPEWYELTDWKKYDVEARRPDAIFIMNPYDGDNNVTSVYPDFYSERLKKFTDTLVYVEYGLPYWVYGKPEAEELEEEYRKNGVILPAHLHCDFVVEYSHELTSSCKQVLKIRTDILRMFGISELSSEDKFVALGSPKFDKVLLAKREDYVLTPDWAEKIGNKKVVLYNTGLSEFLKSSGQQTIACGEYPPEESWYFKKVCSVIEAFSEREDVILWWRPHPLFESTLRSMREELCEEYASIVKSFKESVKGIFDSSDDFHRAIVWSDALISDESSLLLLYAATGKPFCVPSITKALPEPEHDTGEDFSAPLAARLEQMRAAKGANVGDWNVCIWWDNFLEEHVMKNLHYDNFIPRFLDFVVHPEKYPETEEYRRLQLQMIQDFVVNPDGTAGKKIYEFIKGKVLGE